MKLAIFGATGRTGVLLVEQALAAGHRVAALARNPAKISITNPNLIVVRGDVTDPASVEHVVNGVDAVISVLSPTRVGMQNIIRAMQKYNVRRLIAAAGAGVPVPGDQPTMLNNVIGFVIKTTSPKAYNQGIALVQEVRDCDRDWTVVRAPFLTDAPNGGKYKTGRLDKDMGMGLSRADYADFLLKQLNDSTWLRQAPVLSSAK